MSSYENTLRKRGKTLLIVEGKHEKDVLFRCVLKCFPELQIDEDNIWIYKTNIYALYDNIVNEYGDDWVANEDDIDLPYVISKRLAKNPLYYKDDFTNIFLVFDYERHDPRYSISKIEAMERMFNDSADMGKLYLNYPMIESYFHLKTLPDNEYAERTIPISLQPGFKYKKLVKDETGIASLFEFPHKINDYLQQNLSVLDEEIRKSCVDKILNNETQYEIDFYEDVFRDVLNEADLQNFKYRCKAWTEKIGYLAVHKTYWNYMRDILKQIIYHNICKAYRIQYDKYHIEKDEYRQCFESVDLTEILHIQNMVSSDNENGFIWVLNTCIFFVADYNFSMIMN